MKRLNADGLIEEIGFDGNKMHVRKTNPDISALLERNKMMAELAPSMHGEAATRYVGSVDAETAATWARECGSAIGTAEFAAYLKKKLQDGDFAKFRVKGY
jgi:hypothetical protein